MFANDRSRVGDCLCAPAATATRLSLPVDHGDNRAGQKFVFYLPVRYQDRTARNRNARYRPIPARRRRPAKRGAVLCGTRCHRVRPTGEARPGDAAERNVDHRSVCDQFHHSDGRQGDFGDRGKKERRCPARLL
ncbi:hypothetical protein EB820_21275 [Brevibacillus agri]|uniref:Uncharacterized protein n=1 Tax=Brevibacillus agri TaxID=51101 RepID=A0A3M8AHI7_9BACL|nr:hypothetical protein BA6348_08355 [Brevibacillus agri]RNB50539.1 hypothetical protein EB820_21275 [Brevibacillus agri]